MYSDFYKNKENNKIDSVGEFLFSFDKKKIYNFWSDYPEKLSKEEKNIFDLEYPYMSRLKSY